MFNVSLSERLKAAVNQLEATGTSLQARAQAGLQAQQALQSDLPSTIKSRTAEPSTPGRDKIEEPQQADGPLSPRSAAFSPGHLAEGALSGLRGIRGSFNFSRTSLDGQRPATTAPGEKAKENGLRELQELPTTPTSPRPDQAGPSRPQSPARVIPSFQLGSASDPSSSTNTPFLPRSPPRPSHLRLRSPSPRPISLQDLPPPNPDDPASYPLPPSPTVRQSPLLQPTPQYADPLGASPIITPTIDADVPVLGVEAPTPEVERQADELLKEEGGTVEGGTVDNAVEEVKGTADSTEAEKGASIGPIAMRSQSEPTESIASTAIKQSGGDDTGQLQTQILAADEVLRSLTPLEGGIADAQALEGWVRMMVGKVEVMGEEMKRLQGKLALQDSRMEELRDTHRLEGSSQTDLITNLRSQLSTAETTLASQSTDLSALPQLRTDLQKAQTQIKEEEEKRTKAISLLKTVRLKLVKAEKDKEEVEKDRAEERAERSRALDEVERVKADREREVTRLRQGFERELQGVKERAEREMKEKKGAWELEMITTKAAHAKELTSRTTMVNGLEAIVKELSATKDKQFHTIQSRQAEAENARAESETLQNRTKELEFQLREANERVTILEDTSSRMSDRGRPDLLNGDRFRASPSPSPSRSRQNSGGTGTSASELQRLLAEAEARAEGKLSDLRHRIRSLEKERNDQEEEFGQKLQERVFELEKLKRVVQEKVGEVGEADRLVEQERQRTVEEGKKREKVEKDIQGMMARLEEAKEDVATAQDGERLAKDELSQIKLQLQTYNLQLEEQKQLVQNLRAANRTLREELRKVQSSVQLMERSRNPGVGYWSASNGTPGTSSSATTPSVIRNGEDTPILEGRRSMDSTAPSEKNGVIKGNDEEEVNLEYLRNVILQFLENPQMRRQLVQVLSVILHFTPQELRRLNAKITA